MILSLRERAAALRRTHKQSLRLSRARVVSQLKAASNERYRAYLERTLEHLDAQLRELDVGVGERGKMLITTFTEAATIATLYPALRSARRCEDTRDIYSASPKHS